MGWENDDGLGRAIFHAVEKAAVSVLNDYGARAGLHPLVWTLDDIDSAGSDGRSFRFQGCPSEQLELSAALLIAERWVEALPWDPEHRSVPSSPPPPTENHGARRWSGWVEGAPIGVWTIVDLDAWQAATTFPRDFARELDETDGLDETDELDDFDAQCSW